ncbi:acetyl-CoA carboxylase biotin carboxyl carrier protein [Acholeplasma laidlawii]|jgi:acetyl-CoA carboxylase biotin carboxyl carrier protein|uniref:Biotin carboxyl carrier protein of acetyl-CoA carboxylase n=2 Tax=Acholeplasma laidlawii TaxID=2148 RepID=A9NFE6_ACHLI|nr:acetyl-CoA carboxylase biotin carboxyl carrier protein [Acholeplasma laidlawii]ABX81076.1 acetyl-CoA carboxylase, biotin carboxyl carrier protein [Acholeplasma laidlawii PG-8A]NWH10357.1 acetyl-CoA carboxylase biotin carboxyl carrier protein [Acholeplasma laidlawii]NWH11746.1 acetyl-CoA carboxylase biotin carboxyl carrier protein [Acholeplasma laidlawii]NWH12846.1 acetyl-CoA carboxylase biotin carboxyl carrier protein [Acholeplasma laidlawii]NWH14340.1 acetyl-CoA carboxylase biotin carboxyl
MKLNEIKSIIKDFETSTLTVLQLETDNVKLKLSKNKENNVEQVVQSTDATASTQIVHNPQTAVPVAPTPNLGDLAIKSPLVGTFYEASSPDAEPFVKVGDVVKKGQVVCIVEAMKIMNEITSSVDGKVTKINFKNGDVVGFDDVLFAVVQA